MPFMRHSHPRTEDMTLGDNVAMKMSQRTLVMILAVTLAVGAAYADLKSDSKKDHAAVVELITAKQADHDLLVRVAAGVELLQRQADRAERRNSLTNH